MLISIQPRARYSLSSERHPLPSPRPHPAPTPFLLLPSILDDEIKAREGKFYFALSPFLFLAFSPPIGKGWFRTRDWSEVWDGKKEEREGRGKKDGSVEGRRILTMKREWECPLSQREKERESLFVFGDIESSINRNSGQLEIEDSTLVPVLD